uniref:Uncharacterized protein n=1 Tax=Rhizophora mucronata TaxID=61149 RepID=A0A2P2P9Z0_RHIMU
MLLTENQSLPSRWCFA